MLEYATEDVGNIVLLEHVNLQVPDQSLASLFYIVGLGLTRDASSLLKNSVCRLLKKTQRRGARKIDPSAWLRTG